MQRAFDEWLPAHPEAAFVSLNRHVAPGDPGTGLAYKDGCGLGILQRLPEGGGVLPAPPEGADERLGWVGR